MATDSQTIRIHKGLTVLTGAGGLTFLLGMSGYFMGTEMATHARMNSQARPPEAALRNARRWKVAGTTVALLSLIMLWVTLLVWREEKEMQAETVPGMVVQLRNRKAQPDVDEAGLIGTLGVAMVLAGAVLGGRRFAKDETYGVLPSILYALGWIGMAFSASMDNTSIDSVNVDRLAWVLPGAVGVVSGTFMLPYFVRKNYVTSPAFPLMAAGFACFAVGNGTAVKPSEEYLTG